MASIIIPARKNLTISDRFPTRNVTNSIISVGNDGINNYVSYLFFDISSIPCSILISHAELILFKVDKFYDDYNKIFGVYPLNEFFNSLTTFNNYPKINPILKKDFHAITSKVAISIPMTSLVRLWIKNRNVNTSIMLCGRSKNSLVHFGSAICNQKCLIPVLKINFKYCSHNEHISLKHKNYTTNIPSYSKYNSCESNKTSLYTTRKILDKLYNMLLNVQLNKYHLKPTLRRVRVTGTVAPYSKYLAAVNIKIKRHPSNHIDNYYVTDQYDNSLNKKPLHIDKTYNIAIIPRKNFCDTENASFYSSYKE